jgi:hypothetical protein
MLCTRTRALAISKLVSASLGLLLINLMIGSQVGVKKHEMLVRNRNNKLIDILIVTVA